MAGEEDVLAGLPPDRRVVDRETGYAAVERRELGSAGQERRCAVLARSSSRMKDGQVSVHGEARSHEAVEDEERDRDPDPHVDSIRGVDVDHGQEGDEGDEMLQHKELIRPASDRRHRAEDDPGQDAPRAETLPDDRAVLDLGADVVPAGPDPEEVGHVQRHCEEETPGRPSMEPVESLVAGADEKPNDAVLPRQQEQQGQLTERDMARPIADRLPLPVILQIKGVEAQDEQNDGVRGDEQRRTDRRGRKDEGAYPQHRRRSVADLPRDRGDRRTGPREDVLGFCRCR